MENIRIFAFIRSRMLNNTNCILYATGFELRNCVISANFLSFDLFFIEIGGLRLILAHSLE